MLLKQSRVAFLWRSLDLLLRFQQNPLLILLLLMKQKKVGETPAVLDGEALRALCCGLSELVIVSYGSSSYLNVV